MEFLVVYTRCDQPQEHNSIWDSSAILIKSCYFYPFIPHIATILAAVESRYEGTSIGSYPWFKPGQFGTAVVVSGLEAETTQKAAKDVETEVRQLGVDAAIVGADGAPVS